MAANIANLFIDNAIKDKALFAEDSGGFGPKAMQYLFSQFSRMEKDYSKTYSQGERDQMIENIFDFARKTRTLESNNKQLAVNIPQAGKKASSAKGYYQFTDESVNTAFQRYRNTTGNKVWGGLNQDPRKWSEDDSDMMFLANIFGQSGTDDLMEKVGRGDISAMKETYGKKHHTDPGDVKTSQRMDEIFGKEEVLAEALAPDKISGVLPDVEVTAQRIEPSIDVPADLRGMDMKEAPREIKPIEDSILDGMTQDEGVEMPNFFERLGAALGRKLKYTKA